MQTIRLRLRSLFRRTRVEEELDEELRFHLDCRIAREITAGLTPAAARRVALLAMDGLETRKEECRDSRRVHMIENLARDLGYAWRQLWRSPGFTAVAVLTLALGIGANSAIFSLVNAVLLRPLPYPKPDQLMLLFEQIDEPNVVSFPNFTDWERQSHSFAAMAAGRQISFNLGGTGAFQAERIQGAIFSWQIFKALGIQPLMGRGFVAEDDLQSAARVAVISYRLWQHRLGGASDIFHRQIRLDGVNCDVIGVMPPGFGYPNREIDVWEPIQPVFGSDLATNREWHHLYVIARVRDSITIAQATDEVDRIQHRIFAANRGLLGHGATGWALRDITPHRSRVSLYVLAGAAGCLLLIACVNIAHLLLARGAQRAREFSIRASLGARRARLVQQLVTESLLLSLVGATAGLLLAYGLTGALGARASALVSGEDIDLIGPVQVDGWVLAFTAAVSLLTGMGAGLLPARRSIGNDPARALQVGGRTATVGRTQNRVRAGMISAEVALSVVLLIGAGLMIRSVAALQHVHAGVRTQSLLTAGISLPDSRYGSRASIVRFYRTLLDDLRTVPGARSAGLVNCLPITGYCGDNSFNIEGRAIQPGQFLLALDRAASPEYFRIAGIPLLAGRLFSETDGRGLDDRHPRQSAVIVSESMAKKFWPQGNALGQRIFFGDANSPRYEVVGIVGDVLIRLDDHPRPTMYTPALEGRYSDLHAVLDAAGDPAALIAGVRRAVSKIDPDIPAFKIRTMAQIVGESSEQRAFTAALLSCFATLALILSAVGLYGVLSYLIAQRRGELGIRMALGASRSQVCRLVLSQGLGPASLGLLVGLLGAAAISRMMDSVLFGVAARDGLTFVSAPVMLMLVAVAACVVPAWRAACVDPMDALRSE